MEQAAFEYALYMIASSYFDRAECTTVPMEQKLKLNYREQKQNGQYKMEDFCITFMDRFVARKGEELFHRSVEVRLVRENRDLPVSIVFLGEGFRMILMPRYDGRGSTISYKLKADYSL